MTSPTHEDGLDTELESFRRKWLSDLKLEPKGDHQHDNDNAQSAAGSSRRRPSHSHSHSIATKPIAAEDDGDDNSGDELQGQSFDEPPPTSHASSEQSAEKTSKRQLVSALDYYEEAMEKEAQGNMGDSLKLYRKAHRLDNHVDRRYREKHFQANLTTAKPPLVTSSSTASHAPSSVLKPTTVATTAAAASKPPASQPIASLIASFSALQLQPPPSIEGVPPLPCPIAALPSEILMHILRDVAAADVADFSRLALVARPLAFLVATEERIWRRVALGDDVGFAAMHYHWQTGVEWEPLASEDTLVDGELLSGQELARRRRAASLAATAALTPSVYPSWRALFRSRPRIRFNGVYISTVNYVRTGQASTMQATWGQPIHIVTYYRYLRFLRDGGVISLLSTAEPAAVVHHLTRADLELHRGRAHAHLPSAVMGQALKGRWRLSSGADDEEEEEDGHQREEGDVLIETEGIVPKYTYRMDMSLRSAGKGTRNNKLVWKGFYLYNKETDDWGEFGLKNDKPFLFSRVKSYGLGE
ncbi:hypothetical protein G7046_g4844 [Stylonectria norvegica]|nr:hypothetical protein G7046_g4844 [Stylonectria norvegica]